MILFILPNQLFDFSFFKKEIKKHKVTKIALVEEPIYFYDEKYKPFKVNLVKVAYLRASMKCFWDGLKKVFYEVEMVYIDYDQANAFYSSVKDKVCLFDPVDHDLYRKYKDSRYEVYYLNTPYFIHSNDVLQKYVDGCKNKPRHASFYEFSKTHCDIDVELRGVANMDKFNREKPPREEFMATQKEYEYVVPMSLKKYYEEAIDYVRERFLDDGHVGNPDNCMSYPIDHKESLRCFDTFLKERFLYFGKYQDAIMKDHVFMFHSVISPMLNCGLLTPRVVLKKIVAFYKKNKNIVPLAAYEGLLRQILGWRDFERMLYVYFVDDLLSSNVPRNEKKIKNWNAWYYGQTGVMPLDREIKKAVDYGYSHHIVRLMVFMNFMILCELSPFEIYKWFMEVVSMDAYSWVMVSNIWSMGYFWKGAMTKPYLSTSNYILKMSDYKKNGKWNIIWNDLYRQFVSTKPADYVFFYKRTLKKNQKDDDIVLNQETKNFMKQFIS